MKNPNNTYKSGREEFEENFGYLFYGSTISGGLIGEQVWHWHLKSQKRLLYRVMKEVIGEDEEVETEFDNYKELSDSIDNMDNRNEMRENQRSKLQSLIKELEVDNG